MVKAKGGYCVFVDPCRLAVLFIVREGKTFVNILLSMININIKVL